MENEYKNTSQIAGGVGKTPPESIYNSINDNNNESHIEYNDVSLCVDYISCTFDFYQHRDKNAPPLSRQEKAYQKGLNKLLKLFKILTYPSKDEITFDDKGNKFYRDGVYKLGEHINIFLTGSVNVDGLPTNFLEMSGQACRDFEARGGNYVELFKFLTNENANFTRTDSAIDVFTNKYFTIDKLIRYVKKGWYASPLGKGSYIFSWKDHGLTYEGESLYFGSKSSNTLINIYDKLLERFAHGVETFYPAWYRVEIRFKQERAKWFVTNFLDHAESDNDFSFISEALYKTLKFKVPVIENSKGEKVKTRNQLRRVWCDAKWWTRFLNIATEAEFSSKEQRELSIERNKRHIARSDSKILARLFFTDPDNFFTDIMELVYLSHEKLDTVDFTAINKYRKKHNMTEVNSEDIYEITKKLKMMLGAFIEGDEERKNDIKEFIKENS